MTAFEYKALLELLMCADPWPVGDPMNRVLLVVFANIEAKKYGHKDWIDAYHNLDPMVVSKISG